jgi:hypothetical protein
MARGNTLRLGTRNPKQQQRTDGSEVKARVCEGDSWHTCYEKACAVGGRN